MSLDHGTELERALTDHLHDTAPAPRTDALARLARRVEASPQRAAWRVAASSGLAALESGRWLATTAVAAAALVAGILIGQLGAPAEMGPQPSVAATPSEDAAAWEEPASYSFVVEGCGPNDPVGTLRIYVADGVALAFTPLDERAQVYDGYPPEEMPTLGQIMEQVGKAQSMTGPVEIPGQRSPEEVSVPEVRVTTDPVDGHPVEVYIDWIPEAVDDELCYSITEVVVSQVYPECPDEFGWTPPPPLKCAEAVATAISSLPVDHPPIRAVRFEWGHPHSCPPNARCPATMPSQGTVTFAFDGAPNAFIAVEKAGDRVTVVGPLTPVEDAATGNLGLTRAEAIGLANAEAPQTIGREVREARSGPLGEVWEDSLIQEWAQAIPSDTLVWYLYFQDEDDGRGTIVVLDYENGSVYEVMDLRP